MKYNYAKISNQIFDLELTNTELAIFAYLCSLKATVAQGTHTEWVRVRQSVIAQRCGIKTTQTVARNINALMKKGLIKEARRTLHEDNTLGTYLYILNKPSVTDGYFCVDRKAFNGKTPAQLKVYLFICKCIDNEKMYCWNSYNDLAKALKIKREDVIQMVSELAGQQAIRKQYCKQKENRRVYSDNFYFIIYYAQGTISKKRGKEKRLQPSHQCSLTKNNNKRIFFHSHHNTENLSSQVMNNIFLLLRGSSLNRRSLYNPLLD